MHATKIIANFHEVSIHECELEYSNIELIKYVFRCRQVLGSLPKQAVVYVRGNIVVSVGV